MNFQNQWPPKDIFTREVDPGSGIHPEFDQPTERMRFHGQDSDSLTWRLCVLLGKTIAVVALLIVLMLLLAALTGLVLGVVSAL